MDTDGKRALRRAMRAVRRDVAEQGPRSASIVGHLLAQPAIRGAQVVMLFDAVPGEPDLAALASALRTRGVRVVAPDPVPTAAPPVEPGLVDVVVVPGVAFTADGRRLGQGGGWYDRFLADLRDDAVAIGVCFAAQIVDDVPVEPHDRPVDVVIHEGGVVVRAVAG